jgi:hypothetical protein
MSVADLAAALAGAGLQRCPRCTLFRDPQRPAEPIMITTGCDDCAYTGRAHLTTVVVTEDHAGRGQLTLRFGPPGTTMDIAGRHLDPADVDIIVADLAAGRLVPGSLWGIVIMDRR